MIVISNSSPLIALSRIRRLNIFKTLFGHIWIADSVYEETVSECPVPAYRKEISEAAEDFIKVVRPAGYHTFSRNLGKGESGTLSLALEKNPDILLIDDKKARNEARELGINTLFHKRHTQMG
jgi:predicted nucleic acid-binding protein